MASDEHPRKKRRHGNSSKANPDVVQQQQDTQTGHEFQVFLSFRGSDTRNTFTDYLYHSLTDAGIRTFIDNEELRVGEEIGTELMKSIKQSKIAIPIFSKDYASSKWCLKEVAEMVKCMKETKQLIMPVFLDVTPDEVQHQRGSYADPFSQHEKRFGIGMVRGWRHALEEVVKLKGLELNTVASGKQGEFVKFIVARVIRQLKKPYLEVKNILVGIEERAKELVRKLGVGTDDVRAIGVWGMGGIGKTTLAKFVYNRIVDKFESSSFLSDVRETSKTRGLEYLQSKLVSDILRCERKEYANVGEGISVLKVRLHDKKALILLDDVDDINQLNALAADVKWFGRGSRIIITTREKKVLKHFLVQHLYEVALLDDDQALELFCQHAFGDKFPRKGFGEMARDIVNITGRLPLALEVIGSSLSISGGRKDIWKSTVEKLKVKPNMDVQDKLKISYESLEREQKEIFLDIACFFIGMDVRLVIPMWKDAKLFPEGEIEVLLMKSLIKIGEDNVIWMHDQIRDLGRYIVEQENFKETGQRSRLWRGEDAVEVLAGQQVTSKVEAISLEGCHFVEQQDCLDDQIFKNLPSLKVLELNGVRLSGNFQHLFHQLRWLGWHRENESPPVNLILKNLIVLDLSRSLIPEQWIGPSSIEIGEKLKVLNLRNCRISRTPDFSACRGLEILILKSCKQLIYIDPSIGLLKNMILLDVSYCWELKELPKQMGQCNALVRLYMSWGRGLTKLPNLLKLQRLEHLDMNECSYIREIPGLEELSNLRYLDVSKCEQLSQVDELAELEMLQSLYMRRCKALMTLPNLSKLQKLNHLNMEGCENIEEIPGLEELSNLQYFDFSDCEQLSQVDRLAELEMLQSLNMGGCYALMKLPNLSKLQRLDHLNMDECKNIVEIPGLEKLSNLQYLDLSGCEQLSQVDGLVELEMLQFLGTRQCKALTKLPNLSKLQRLEYLDIQGCNNIMEIPGLDELSNLQYLYVSKCEQLSQVDGVAELEMLCLLDVGDCNALTKLPNLSKLQRLENLYMEGCKNIVEIPGLKELNNLECLAVFRCDALKLPDLSKQQVRNGLQIIGRGEEK